MTDKLVKFTEKEAETIHQAMLTYSPHPKVIKIIAEKLERLSDGWKR